MSGFGGVRGTRRLGLCGFASVGQMAVHSQIRLGAPLAHVVFSHLCLVGTTRWMRGLLEHSRCLLGVAQHCLGCQRSAQLVSRLDVVAKPVVLAVPPTE